VRWRHICETGAGRSRDSRSYIQALRIHQHSHYLGPRNAHRHPNNEVAGIFQPDLVALLGQSSGDRAQSALEAGCDDDSFSGAKDSPGDRNVTCR